MSGMTMHFQQAAQIERLSNEVKELKQRLIDLETAMAKLTVGSELSVGQERAVDDFKARHNITGKMIRITPEERVRLHRLNQDIKRRG